MGLKATTAARSKKFAGKPLYPHKHRDGSYVASRTKFEVDYIRVPTLDELEALVREGFSARMSNPEIGVTASSLIKSDNIEVTTKPGESTPSIAKALLTAIDSSHLDIDSRSKRRLEQAYLRAFLLKKKSTGLCQLCGGEFPENLLVAAHLKRRSKCSLVEKRDFKNVAALMCKLGCDDFYEKGYVFVDQGKIRQNSRRIGTPPVILTIKNLLGRPVANWPGSKEYYLWHEKHNT